MLLNLSNNLLLNFAFDELDRRKVKVLVSDGVALIFSRSALEIVSAHFVNTVPKKLSNTSKTPSKKIMK